MATLINEALTSIEDLSLYDLQAIFDIDSEQFQFRDAPTGVPLLVTSDLLVLIERHGQRKEVPGGSVIIKLTLEQTKELNYWYRNNDDVIGAEEVVYMVLFNSESDILEKCDKCSLPDSMGVVVPLSEVYCNENSLQNTSVSIEESLTLHNDKANIQRVIREAEPKTLTVLVLGEYDTSFSKSWKDTVNPFDAVRWTNESADLPIVMKSPKVIHIIKKGDIDEQVLLDGCYEKDEGTF